MAIEIDRFKRYDQGGRIATFTAKFIGGPLDGTEIECTAVRKKDGGWFIAGPQRAYDSGGVTKYWSTCRLGQKLEDAIRQAVHAQVEAALQPVAAGRAESSNFDDGEPPF